jgi:hypothetical protein
MGWTDTHRYYATLRAVEDELNRRGDGVIVWHREYADVFGSVQVLRLALHTRWETMLRAQVDVPCDAEGRPSPELCELAAAHRGLLLALARKAPAVETRPRAEAALVGVA